MMMKTTMKKITRNSYIFAGINIITTIVFLIYLNKLVSLENYNSILLPAIIYGMIWFVSGFILGVTDNARNYSEKYISFLYISISAVIQTFSLWLSKLLFPNIMPLSYMHLLFVSIGVGAAIGGVLLFLETGKIKFIKLHN